MRKGGEVPVVPESANMEKVILEMTVKKMGCTMVVGKKGKLTGIITDQNLRNHLKDSGNILKKKASDVMTPNPKTISKDAFVSEAIRVTEEKSISTLLVIDKAKRPIGIVHLHDLLRLT
jgi:arabinose-5-phosphate isomerase